MAYQFIHVETYSEASRKVKGTEDHFNSATQVLGEAMRKPEYSMHVQDPGRVYRLGGTMSVKELQAKRTKILSSLQESVTRKNGTTYQRKLRKDAATLYTEIHSHPLPATDYLNAPDMHHPDIKKWYTLAMADFKARMPADIDWAAVMHLDEGFVHFHVLAINTDDPRLDANKLHAGKAAASKLRAELDAPTALASLPKPKLGKRPNKPKQPRPSKNRNTQRKNETKREADLAVWEADCAEVERENAKLLAVWETQNAAHLKEARKTRGPIPEKQAYTAAMKALQDGYYEAVGKPCGLLRDGPRKERLSTQEYDRRKKSAEKLSSALDQTENHANQFLELKEDYKQKAAALAAEKSEFEYGIAAMEELVDQIEEGRASVTDGHVEMDSPQSFFLRFLGQKQPSSRTGRLFQKLLKVIGRVTISGQAGKESEVEATYDPFGPSS